MPCNSLADYDITKTAFRPTSPIGLSTADLSRSYLIQYISRLLILSFKVTFKKSKSNSNHNGLININIKNSAATRIPRHARLHPPRRPRLLQLHRSSEKNTHRILQFGHSLRKSLVRSSRKYRPSLHSRRPSSRRPEHLELRQSPRTLLGRSNSTTPRQSCHGI